ncbi:hypothetical protein J7E73_28305 [Paenibacillus albidus]|uniref:hypothetical protein n=1 Tax=Paenibacillus albidus TaxID=2041023 RepID=UPI001BE76552|nr:hypothetical protein [Paenibacillus albidus]MBT2292948.1 hypothetical protein [Paenibacillus albidus]
MNLVRMIIRRFAEHKLLFGVFLFSAFLEILYASAAPGIDNYRCQEPAADCFWKACINPYLWTVKVHKNKLSPSVSRGGQLQVHGVEQRFAH